MTRPAELAAAAILTAGSAKKLFVFIRFEFLRHTADFDNVVARDPQAPPLWARHYEIGANRPVFAGRDGVGKYALADIERERRTGTPWYGNWPLKLLEREYPKWRAEVAGPHSRPHPAARANKKSAPFARDALLSEPKFL